MFQLYPDPFTQWLEAQGAKPDVHHTAAGMEAPAPGWQVQVGQSVIVYRIEPADPAAVNLVLIESKAKRSGLRSAFGDLIRFIRLLHRSDTGLTHVQALSRHPADDPESRRMEAFCMRRLGFHVFTDAGGTGWVRGSIEEALRLHELRCASKASPGAVMASALALQQRGQIDGAMRLYRRVLERDALNHEALQWLATAHAQKREFVEALDLYARALKLRPDYAEAHRNRGVALHEIGRYEEALQSFDRALALRPDQAETHNNRGTTLRATGRDAEALAAYDCALKWKPCYAGALKNRGIVLRSMKRPAAALADFDAALALMPEAAPLWNYRGHALSDLDRYEEALASTDRALELKPDYADAHFDRSLVLGSLMRHEEAIASCERAIALHPDHADAQWHLAALHLITGDFERGWPRFEWRWRSRSYGLVRRELDRPMWLGGQDIAGKVMLVSCDGGYGDVIQFCRYVPMLMERGATVILEAGAGVLPLLRESFPGLRLATYREPLPEFDLHCPVMSLPGAFACPVEALPATLPYLKAPAASMNKWAAKLGPATRRRIGIVCSGSLSLSNDRHRSIPMRQMARLVQADAEFHCLQKEIRGTDRAVFESLPVRTWEAELHDYTDTAALVMQMDLVITVDTSVAHLAGALGKPVWLLLPHAPDPRWLLGREDSPWYPQVMRLFRQPATNDWSTALEHILADLRRL